MQPSIIGAQEAELPELEALAHDASGTPLQRAEGLVLALFARLAEEAEEERWQVEQQRLPDTVAKRNRRETYLDPRLRQEWQDRSRRFLGRLAAAGGAERVPLGEEALYSTLAMQHFLSLDVEDLHLAPAQQRSEDSFTDGVNAQFFLDASRGRFTVNGEVFCFRDATSEEEDSFVARLEAAVRAAAPPALLERVTTAMSQSGLAALEKASLCTVAVSGGSLSVHYALTADPAGDPGSAVVELGMQRRDFREYFAGCDDLEPLPSDAGSTIWKAATVLFRPDGDVDVRELDEGVEIRRAGRLLPTAPLRAPVPAVRPCAEARAAPGAAPCWSAPRCLCWALRWPLCCCRWLLRRDAREWAA